MPKTAFRKSRSAKTACRRAAEGSPNSSPRRSGRAVARPARAERSASSLLRRGSGRLVRPPINLDRWRSRNRFYHERKAEYLRFIIPEGESVLLIGCEDGALLEALRPSRGLGVDHRPEFIALARKRTPQFVYALSSDLDWSVRRTFEYIVLNDVACEIEDLFVFLQRVARHCTPTSRVVVVQHNYLWRPLFRLAAWLGLKRPEARQNWLSAGDLRVFLDGAGFETIEVRSKLFCPARLLGLGSAINWVAGMLPFVHRLASAELLVARRRDSARTLPRKSASIVLTTRDERGNIEPLVRAIPRVGTATEIIFVEGHSRDGTRAEIERVIDNHPAKKIRLVIQDGEGQGNAIRKGFSEAEGDVIILLEADQTTAPADVIKAFDIIASGRADYVNGSRFIYPRDKGAMPLFNAIGNWLFAAWFTWFLGQRTSDVLCGLKAIDRRQFQRLEKNWGFLGLFDPFGDFELIFGAARLGLKISEVPTRYGRRSYGRPKTKVFRHGMMLLRMASRATRVFKCR